MATAAMLWQRVEVRVVGLSARLALACLVVASAAIRFAFALQRPTPDYLPDEYTYSALARSIATTGRPDIRGVSAHFPALLEPILAAPFWLTGSPGVAYRLTQAEHAALMSLAAIPVYLLCRRLALGTAFSLGAAAVALASPSLLYASYIVADPVAYPLVLAAVYVAVVTLESPTRRSQLALVGLLGLAAFARIQYLLLVPAVLIAALVVERGSVRRVVIRYRLAVSSLAAIAIVGLAVGRGRVLGVYGSTFDVHVRLSTYAHLIGTHLLLLPFSAGIVLVPGALVGLGRGLRRPDSRAERAFAALTVPLAVGLIAEAALIAASISGNYGERYLICLFPLLLPAFGLYVRRGGAVKTVVAISAGLALLAMRVQLSGYTAGNSKSDSTMLSAAYRVERSLGVGNGALLISLVAVLLALVAAFVGLRPRRRVWLALAAALIAQGAVSVGATSLDLWGTKLTRSGLLPADLRWVDDARVGHSTLLEAPGSDIGTADLQLFWNTSIARVALLPGAAPIDSGENPLVPISHDGSMLGLGGSSTHEALLVDDSRTWVSFSGARLVRFEMAPGANSGFALWQPTGVAAPKVVLEAVGVRADGWLTNTGFVTVYRTSAGPQKLTLRLTVPAGAVANAVRFRLPDGGEQVAAIRPGKTRAVVFTIPPTGMPWVVHWKSESYGSLGDGQYVSLRAQRPELASS